MYALFNVTMFRRERGTAITYRGLHMLSLGPKRRQKVPAPPLLMKQFNRNEAWIYLKT